MKDRFLGVQQADARSGFADSMLALRAERNPLFGVLKSSEPIQKATQYANSPTLGYNGHQNVIGDDDLLG